MRIYRLTVRLTTDFQTAGDTHGSTIDVLKSAIIKDGRVENRLVIPASHIKGVLRQEARRLGIDKRTIELMFGREEQENGKEGYKEPAVKFFDLYAPMRILNERVHVKISLEYGSNSANEGGLHSKKLVPAGTTFTGYIAVKGGAPEDSDKVLKAALRSAQHYGIGGERSRGLGGFEGDITEISVDEFKKEVL